MAITQKEIFDFLDARDPDTKMTLREMRSLLGGGSLETLSRAVRAYRQAKVEQQALAMPEAFAQAFQKFALDAWTLALEQTKEAVAQAQAVSEENVTKLEATVKDLDERLAVCHGENNDLKARVAALTEDAAKQKALLDVAEERALEFAGERDAARAEVESLKKALSEAKIAQATAEAALAAYKHALGD